jgi:hypothetical protein
MIRCLGIAGFVFLMPEIEVGSVLRTDQGIDVLEVGIRILPRARHMPELGGLVVYLRDEESIKHLIIQKFHG